MRWFQEARCGNLLNFGYRLHFCMKETLQAMLFVLGHLHNLGK
jgi:hypothetical protein